MARNEDEWVRQAAIVALGNMGSRAGDAVPALTDALHGYDAKTRKVAAEALKKIKKEK